MISLFCMERHGLYSDFLNFFLSPFLIQTTNIVQEIEGESITRLNSTCCFHKKKKNKSDVCFSIWTQYFVFFEQWVAI